MINTTDTAPTAPRLSIRVQGENPLHHLWNNNGTWWIHYTIHPDACTKARIRRSLRTHDLATAIVRRDEILGARPLENSLGRAA
jgi:hypothetical protein